MLLVALRVYLFLWLYALVAWFASLCNEGIDLILRSALHVMRYSSLQIVLSTAPTLVLVCHRNCSDRPVPSIPTCVSGVSRFAYTLRSMERCGARIAHSESELRLWQCHWVFDMSVPVLRCLLAAHVGLCPVSA